MTVARRQELALSSDLGAALLDCAPFNPPGVTT